MNSLYTFTQSKSPDEPICNRIIPYNNNTAVIPGYEGIPQNLLINFISWVALTLDILSNVELILHRRLMIFLCTLCGVFWNHMEGLRPLCDYGRRMTQLGM
ncbi:hypothetical protein PHET_10853 [Paragonimus heterotremus]|uniref:Uncharacterized protein n=1 Tax=Paragonimus heterotremus TaxID=100268 RepID=A0A8J4T9N3_9TREM|nr:hypothetical protein PHET_10853 [Paragonimus heterotremus]